MYLSIGYIHRQCTGPHVNSCCTRCTGRCVITFKNVVGNSFFNKHVAIMTLWSTSSCSACRTSFSHNFWNTLHIRIIAFRTFSSKTFHMATGRTYRNSHVCSWLLTVLRIAGVHSAYCVAYIYCHVRHSIHCDLLIQYIKLVPVAWGHDNCVSSCTAISHPAVACGSIPHSLTASES